MKEPAYEKTPDIALNLPPLLKVTTGLLLLIIVGFLVWIGGSILAPLVSSFLIALLLLPLDRWMERKGVPRGASIGLCILLVVVVLASLIWFFSSQIVGFEEQLPAIEKRATVLFAQLQKFVEARFGVDPKVQIDYIKQGAEKMMGSQGGGVFSGITGFTGDLVTVLGIMPIYIFFIMYYRNFFEEFISMIFPRDKDKKVHKVMDEIETVSQSYLVGLFTVIVIVATLNTIGLLLLGIENALFFASLASVLAVIPYIGIAIGSILPMLMALVTKDSAWYAVGVVGVMWFVQFLEGNFITPKIVGSKVSVNPLAAILALFIGAALWGAIGMVLAIPFTAILKVIFDNVDGFKPIGFLIGEPPADQLPKPKRISKLERAKAALELEANKAIDAVKA